MLSFISGMIVGPQDGGWDVLDLVYDVSGIVCLVIMEFIRLFELEPLPSFVYIVIIAAHTMTKGNVLHFECPSPVFLLIKALKTIRS